MSEIDPKDKVGYRSPPKHSQWKKGQSGNPNPKRRAHPKKLSVAIEEVFNKEIDVFENGVKRRATVFEAIVLQLWLKATTGHARAIKVLQKYERFSASRPEYKMREPARVIDAARAKRVYEELMAERIDEEPSEFSKMIASMSAIEASAFYCEYVRTS